jgi:protein-disulfide isomerase
VNKILVASVFLFGVIGAVFLINDRSNEPEPAQTTTEQSIPQDNPDTRLIIGDSSNPVRIIEYTDYKCPNCNIFHRTTYKELNEKFANDIYFEVRAYPAFGPDSGRSLRGAYCANEQDKFPEYNNVMYDYIWFNHYESGDYAAQIEDIYTPERLQRIASDINLDADGFLECIMSDRMNQFIDRDLLAAADDGVTGTPGFVINEQNFVGRQPITVFETLIEIAKR